MQEQFLDEIDDKLASMGYSDRSAFIREAVYKEMERNGISLPAALKTAPQRKGKGGRPKKVVDLQAPGSEGTVLFGEVKGLSKVADEASDPEGSKHPKKKASYRSSRGRAKE